MCSIRTEQTSRQQEPGKLTDSWKVLRHMQCYAAYASGYTNRGTQRVVLVLLTCSLTFTVGRWIRILLYQTVTDEDN